MRDLQRQLGRRVADLRHLAGLTQMQLADRADTTLDTISRLERGASLPGIAKLAVIADALGVQLWQVFRWEEAELPGVRADVLAILDRCDGDTLLVIRDVAARIARED